MTAHTSGTPKHGRRKAAKAPAATGTHPPHQHSHPVDDDPTHEGHGHGPDSDEAVDKTESGREP